MSENSVKMRTLRPYQFLVALERFDECGELGIALRANVANKNHEFGNLLKVVEGVIEHVVDAMDCGIEFLDGVPVGFGDAVIIFLVVRPQAALHGIRMAEVFEELRVFGFPTVQPRLVVGAFGVNFRPDEELVKQADAGGFEGLGRAFEALEEQSPDEGDHLFLATGFEVLLVGWRNEVGNRIVNREGEERYGSRKRGAGNHW